MNISSPIQVAILISLATQVGCFVSVKRGRNLALNDGDVLTVPIGACVDRTTCGGESSVRNANEPVIHSDANEHRHTAKSVYTKHGQLDHVRGHSAGEKRQFGQTSPSPRTIFNTAFQLWDNAETLYSRLNQLQKVLHQLQPTPKHQLNSNAMESSILDLLDQLEDQVFQVTDKFQPLDGEPAERYPDNSFKIMTEAKHALRQITGSYNHLVKVVEQKTKKYREYRSVDIHDTSKRSITSNSAPKKVDSVEIKENLGTVNNVRFAPRKPGLYHIGVFWISVIATGLLFLIVVVLVSMSIKKKQLHSTLPFTVYDK